MENSIIFMKGCYAIFVPDIIIIDEQIKRKPPWKLIRRCHSKSALIWHHIYDQQSHRARRETIIWNIFVRYSRSMIENGFKELSIMERAITSVIMVKQWQQDLAARFINILLAVFSQDYLSFHIVNIFGTNTPSMPDRNVIIYNATIKPHSHDLRRLWYYITSDNSYSGQYKKKYRKL